MRCSICSEDIRGTIFSSGERKICFACFQSEGKAPELRCDSCGDICKTNQCIPCEVSESGELPEDPSVRAVVCKCGEFNVIPSSYVGRYLCLHCKSNFDVLPGKGQC
jgi:hypothetical protein